ncbi:MAG: hypothetical protein IJK67_02765 [Bacilli bacterium]|nr:hypothetical protein [Bacilli bacterium]
MKKKLLILTFIILLLSACKTQQEMEEEKENQRINEITKEVEKNTEISEEAKKWLIDNKATKVLTIFCMKTSSRCNKLKEEVKEYESKLKVYYIEMDETDDTTKETYKTTYELKEYTGYLPYVILVNNNKLIDYSNKITDIKDIKELLIKNKIVSE